MASIYVGTYAKYNAGSIAGAWLDLEDYSSPDEFYAAARNLHADEPDPELMFQDWGGIPNGMVGECYLDGEALWEWIDLDESDKELLTVYREEIDRTGTLEQAQEAFRGRYDDEEDWARNWWEDTGMLADIPEHARAYIDFERYARDARYGGNVTFVRHKGECWVFLG